MKALVIPSIFTAIDKFTGPVKGMARDTGAAFERMQRDMRKAGQTAFSVGKKSALIGAAIILPLSLAANEAIKFEESLADIGKTTGLADAKLEKFGDGILKLSETTRTSIEDLAKIAEIGGQLGIAEKDLLSFTNASDKFNIALGSDFGSVDEAISQVGKIKGLFETTRELDVADSINKTGSAINELGAIGAGTSANITDFALRMGALPDALKPSIENTLALGTFLEEMGINSERGASGLSKVLLVAGQNLGSFANQMGSTKNEASKLLAEDPTKFVTLFAKSFEGLAPEQLAMKLKDLKLNSQEAIKVIGALGGGTKRLAELQEASNKAFSEGTSLQDEAAKKNATTAAKMAIMKNKMQSLAITIGQALLPVISDLIEAVTPVIKSFSKWAKQNKSMLGTIIKVVAAVAGFAFAISGVAFAIGIAQKAMVIFNFVMSASPVGLVVVGVIALGVALFAVSKAFNQVSTAQKLNNEVTSRALDATIDQRVEVTMLFKALRKAEEGSSAYNSTLEKLEAMQPGIIEKYDLQTKSIEKINQAEKALIQTIMQRAKIQAAEELTVEKTKAAITAEQGGPGFMDNALEIFKRNALATVTFGISEITGAQSLVIDSAEEKNKQEVKQLFSEADILATQVAEFQAVNPEKTKQDAQNSFIEKTTTNKVELLIKNETGNEIEQIGGNANFAMPTVK